MGCLLTAVKGIRGGELSSQQNRLESRSGATVMEKSSCGSATATSGIEVPAFCQVTDAIRGTEGQRHDGHGRLAAAGSYQASAIAEEKVLHVVRLVVPIDYRRLGIVAHPAGAEQVHAELLFF